MSVYAGSHVGRGLQISRAFLFLAAAATSSIVAARFVAVDHRPAVTAESAPIGSESEQDIDAHAADQIVRMLAESP